MLITGLVTGAVLGVILQRGRFCVTGMLRDIYTQRSFRTFTALLIVIAVQAVGVAALTTLGIITPENDPFAPIAVIIGSLLFGIGIVLAGGCASGTWYRAGEGLVGSWLALGTYALSAAAMKTGPLTGLNGWLRSYRSEHVSLPQTTGLSPWVFAIALALFTGWLALRYVKASHTGNPVATLQLGRGKKPLHIYVAAILVGIVGVIAWPLSAATGRNDGLGITTPSKNVVNYIATGDSAFIDWGTLLVLGILIGSVIAATWSGEFRVRVPDGITATRSLIGGVFMGIGASWAGGCTVGNGMVQTSLFSYQGWLALLFTGIGVAVAAKIWLKPTIIRPRTTPEENPTYTTQQSITDTADLPSGATTPQANPRQELAGLSVAPSAVAVKIKPTAATDSLYEVEPGVFVLDQLGAVCPFPLIDAKAAFDTLSSGQKLVIDFDCTQATEAIPRWAADNGYEITNFTQVDNAGWQITVLKP